MCFALDSVSGKDVRLFAHLLGICVRTFPQLSIASRRSHPNTGGRGQGERTKPSQGDFLGSLRLVGTQ